MFLIILIKSLIIGGLVGVGVGAGAARMFHAPTTQGMGAFRTLGELNSCEGDPASHFSFGLGFFFNAWASSVASIWLVGGLILMSLGVIGIYISKIYKETKHRPAVVVARRYE